MLCKDQCPNTCQLITVLCQAGCEDTLQLLVADLTAVDSAKVLRREFQLDSLAQRVWSWCGADPFNWGGAGKQQYETAELIVLHAEGPNWQAQPAFALAVNMAMYTDRAVSEWRWTTGCSAQSPGQCVSRPCTALTRQAAASLLRP